MAKYARKKTTYTARPKKYYAKKRTYTAAKRAPVYRRKRTYKSAGSGRYARGMQESTFQYVKKKYTVVFPVQVEADEDNAAVSISIMGGRNSTSPGDTLTLGQVDPDGLQSNDMAQHQHFKITGMASKLFFPEGTSPEATPVQWSMSYSGSQVINAKAGFGPLQALSTFQTSSCDSSRPIKRYFVPNKQLQRLGVDWCQCAEITDGDFTANPPRPLYGGQLPVNSGSSLQMKVTRGVSLGAPSAQIARLQVTYYVTYRGVLGNNAII